MNNDDYESYLLRAEKSATYQERVQNCLDAIYVKPNEIEAYKKLIEAYKEDAVFTVDEEAQFKSAINSHLKELSNSKGYADLAFETGKLYWYFYDYGKTAEQDNQVTRMKSAIQWFEDACTYATEENDAYRMASVYKEIGKFNQDVTIKVEEASDQGMYLPYYQNLKKLYEMVENQDKDEIVDLEVYRICLFSIEQYVRKFQSDEVPQDDIHEFLQAVIESTQNTQTTSDKTDELKRDILDRVSQTQQAVMRAYGGT